MAQGMVAGETVGAGAAGTAGPAATNETDGAAGTAVAVVTAAPPTAAAGIVGARASSVTNDTYGTYGSHDADDADDANDSVMAADTPELPTAADDVVAEPLVPRDRLGARPVRGPLPAERAGPLRLGPTPARPSAAWGSWRC